MLNWPYPNAAWQRNHYLLDAMYQVWRVVSLYNKPKTRHGAEGVETNWTAADIDLWDWIVSGEADNGE